MQARVEDDDTMTGGDRSVLAARSIGEALRLLRHRAKLPRDDVSARAGIASGTLSRYENDVTTKPDPVLLRQLTMFLAAECDEDGELVWHEMGAIMDRKRRQAYTETLGLPYEVRKARHA